MDRRTDGRIDMTKLIVAIRKFANSPRNKQYHVRTSSLLAYRLLNTCCNSNSGGKFSFHTNINKGI